MDFFTYFFEEFCSILYLNTYLYYLENHMPTSLFFQYGFGSNSHMIRCLKIPFLAKSPPPPCAHNP